MNRLNRCVLVAVLLINGFVFAEEKPLDGGQIKQILTGNTAYLDNGAIQTFAADGASLYFQERRALEHGSWKVAGDEYCSEWGGRWSCYKMTGQINGDSIRITWQGQGASYPARIEPGNALQ